MRIVGGEWRGRTLASVAAGDPGGQLRPTADRVRENIFNLLAHGAVAQPVKGARVLDLFAGTGALGLEALSRGAETAYLVENGRAADLITENIKRTGAKSRARLLRNDATKLGRWSQSLFDLVFLDPPYGQQLGQKAVMSAHMGGWLSPEVLIVWEENTVQTAPGGFSIVDSRQYGKSVLTFLRYG
ncbi:MAG: 16S rRNA (guanine(966)-N(2))-methyltransferase RsmD [Pseudomonadota bacterium]